MKILITNPTLHYSHGHKFVQPDWPSLTLPYLAGICGLEHDIRILDHSHRWKYQIEKTVLEFEPELVLFSVIAGRDVRSILPEVLRVGGPKIVGGQGAAANAKEFEAAGAIVCPDEAELFLPNYLRAREAGTFERIDIDESPIPRWDLVQKTKSSVFRTYTGSIEMSRGCPHKCEFCCTASFWGSYRAKMNALILCELHFLSNENRKHIYLTDDNFGVNYKKHMDLFEYILSMDQDFKFFTQIRADTVVRHPDMLKMAAKAGFYGVLVGFDSYDNDTLDENHKTTSAEINNEAAAILRENKIAIYGSHIYGLPGQKSFEKTFEMGRKNSDLFAMPYFDGRPKIPRPAYDREYAEYVHRAQFAWSEIAGVFHPDLVIRDLKRGGWRRYWNCTRGYEKEKAQ